MAAPEIPTTFPAYLVAGATWEWRQRLYDQATGDEFLADDGGTVTMRLLGQHSLGFTATADTDEDDWLFSVATTTTDDITTAKANQFYSWRILGDLSGTTYDLGSGTVFVHANPDVVAGGDRRTHAQKMVPLIEAEIEARFAGTAGTGHNAYTLLGRSIEKWGLDELVKLLAHYQALVERDVHGRPKPFLIHFGLRRQ